MTGKEALLRKYLDSQEKSLGILSSAGLDFVSGELIWQVLIYELDHADVPHEVIFHNFSEFDIAEIVSGYFQRHGIPVGVVSHDLDLTGLDAHELEKADVKVAGKIWTVHKSDIDPFPSNPHAHNYEEKLKLHLGNGGLYRKTKLLGSIRSKELIAIREKIKKRLPSLVLPKLEV